MRFWGGQLVWYVVCEKSEESVIMPVWPLGEGAAKPGIEMAQRDIVQQKRIGRDERCNGSPHKAWKWLERSIPLAPFFKGGRGLRDVSHGYYENCFGKKDFSYE